MSKKILINATQSEEIRVAIVSDNTLIDLDIEASHRIQKKANIYKARVSRTEPSLNAIFVDYGADRHGFLPIKELAPEYQDKGKPSIKEGDEIVIQIEKEERGTKGAAVTTLITLAGCYLVLMPNSHRGGGVSRRIEGEDRQQLKELLNNLTVPREMSVIARTACLGRTQEELQWDLNALLKLWATIQEESQKHKAPFLIYQESDVILRSVRDYLRQDIDEIIVDERKTYERVLELVRNLRPDFAERVRFYHNDIGLLTYHRIESQIETAYQREVKLSSGGSIVIDHTEALTSIDINSARATKGGDIEETALSTNLEAAHEVARQLKLRDLGGLIVIDFIDMEEPKNQRQVEDALAEAVKSDRARIQMAKISRFGLLEMSRQRLRPSLEESSGMLCPRCSGQGSIRGVESLSLSILRLIQEEAMRADTLEVHVQVPINVVTFILNEKRNVLAQIETQNKVRVVLVPNPNLETPHYTLTKVTQSSEEVTPSYMMQVPLETESYKPTQTKLQEVEQPAIRELTISAAPSRSLFKRTLGSLISKIQEAFTAETKENLSIKHKLPHDKRRSGNGSRDTRGGNRNHRNHNDNRRRHGQGPRSEKATNERGAERTNDRVTTERGSERTQERTHNNERRRNPHQTRSNPERSLGDDTKRNENSLAKPSVNKAPAPARSAQKTTPKTSVKPTIHEFTVQTIDMAVAVNKPVELSPQVLKLLGAGLLPAQPSNQIESSSSIKAESKLKREEVVSTTEFSVEAARTAIKKQHEVKGERVETQTASKYVAQTTIANKDVAILDTARDKKDGE